MENRKRNTAILLIITGLFLLFGKVIGFFTITGFFIIWLAVHMFRKGETKTGYILLAAGIVIISSKIMMFLFAIIVLLIVYYYVNSTKKTDHIGNFMERFSLLESWKQNTEPWVLKDMSLRTIIGEINLDLSLAINDKEETVVNLEGIIGDIDIIVPEELGLSLEASVLLGEINIGTVNESGAMNKMTWQSPNYDDCEYKVKLRLSYIIGDIAIKLL